MQTVTLDAAKPALALDKLAYRMSEAQAVSGLSRSTLYQLIASQRLSSIKVGGRRLIPAESLRALLAVR
jgi:excisionase family DNA binding protein